MFIFPPNVVAASKLCISWEKIKDVSQVFKIEKKLYLCANQLVYIYVQINLNEWENLLFNGEKSCASINFGKATPKLTTT